MIDILTLINALKETDKYIEVIFLNGGCYRFHLFLKKIFPEAMPYINKDKNHVITEYKGVFYDVTGEVSGNGYTKMTKKDVEMASFWSFSKMMCLSVNNCPNCGEPILI